MSLNDDLSHTVVLHRLQNHRGWKGPQEVKSNSPAKAGTLQWVAQVDMQLGLECFH